MKKFLIFLATAYVLIGCQNSFNRQEPIRVVVRDLVEKTDKYIIERRMYYTLDSVVVDTIPKNQTSFSLPEPNENYIPDDVVDLNDLLPYDENDDTDYNYTELNEDEVKFLEEQGIYWDEKIGYWRKKR